MQPLLLALIACGSRSASVPTLPLALHVEVSARVTEPGTPAAWTARATWGRLANGPRLPPGVCRRPVDRLEPDATSPLDTVEITGPTGGALERDPARGVFVAVGPRQTLDPAWGVGDLAWSGDDGVSHLAEGVVRFGALPEISRVSRDREGAVELGWNPATVSAPEVRVRGPAGELVCGAAADGTTLPWWVVPAYGGEVVLRSTHEEAGTVDGARVRVRTVLERVIRLDAPAGTTADEKAPVPVRTPDPAPASSGPRRVLRAARSPVG